uniref:CD99 antigen-like 2 n=1 Tax=Bubo bubo TaxID=30461 RepID=A0A8C0EWM2_BUBBB
MSLCALRCLSTELKTCKIILFSFFIGSFDDSDLYDGSLPKGGGDGSDSNGKVVGCASIDPLATRAFDKTLPTKLITTVSCNSNYWFLEVFIGFTLRQYKFLILKNVHKLFFFTPPASQGAVAGIVSAVVATVIGAVSSFIAYQKKKLCFKQSGKNSKLVLVYMGARN